MSAFCQNQFKKKRKIISEINITPFVDVLLVLLIIFMVAAPMMTGKVDVNLPSGSSEAGSATSSKSITVSVKIDGSIYLQENQVKLSKLAAMLNQLTASDFSNKILVRADKSLDYGRVMDVVREIGSAGYSQVVLVTEIQKGAAANQLSQKADALNRDGSFGLKAAKSGELQQSKND